MPGTKAFRFWLRRQAQEDSPMPVVEDMDNIDASYTTNIPHAVDFFFDLDVRIRIPPSAASAAG